MSHVAINVFFTLSSELSSSSSSAAISSANFFNLDDFPCYKINI